MSTYDENNIFAKILRNELPCHKVYEDADTFVLMDIMPRGTGHCLVIPKRPARTIIDADDLMLAKIYSTVRKISKAALEAYDADGLTIQQFNEPAGGQVVFHLHVHIIPRFNNVRMRPHTGEMESDDVLAENADKLIRALEKSS